MVGVTRCMSRAETCFYASVSLHCRGSPRPGLQRREPLCLPASSGARGVQALLPSSFPPALFRLCSLLGHQPDVFTSARSNRCRRRGWASGAWCRLVPLVCPMGGVFLLGQRGDKPSRRGFGCGEFYPAVQTVRVHQARREWGYVALNC